MTRPPQTVHGGLILSLTDTLGSLAVATKGQYMTGVSTDIGTSFVKPSGRTGDILFATATLTGIGKSLAYTRTEFKNAKGDLLAYGCEPNIRSLFKLLILLTCCVLDHTKYIGKSSINPVSLPFNPPPRQAHSQTAEHHTV